MFVEFSHFESFTGREIMVAALCLLRLHVIVSHHSAFRTHHKIVGSRLEQHFAIAVENAGFVVTYRVGRVAEV